MRTLTSLPWKCRERILTIDKRPLIMGILNVTPDSFSDGGKYNQTSAAIQRGTEIIEQGADIIDIGGESTRPGSVDVDAKEEIERVIPVIRELRRHSDAIISVDTTKAVVANAAMDAGADIINDVSALTLDSDMINVARKSGAGLVIMHMQGTPRTMQNNPQYNDVATEVSEYLQERVKTLILEGIRENCITVDPGIGFGKSVEHNLQLLARLDVIGKCGRPVVVGLSRKSFLGKLTGNGINERQASSLSANVFSALNGAHILRVHDIKETREAILVAMELHNRLI